MNPFRLITTGKIFVFNWTLVLILVYSPLAVAAENPLSFIPVSFPSLLSNVKPLFSLMTDINGDQQPELVSARDNVLLLQELTYARVQGLQKVVDRPVTSLAVSDLNGDGDPEILLGLADPGAIDIYSRQEDQWVESSSRRYLFSSPTSMLVFDAGIPPQQLVGVTTLDGRILLYQWLHNDLVPVGNEYVALTGQVARFIGAYDLNGDKRNELVVTTGQSGIGVLTWDIDGLKLAWNNFPWGGIEGVTIGDLDQNGLPEIIVSTAQRILYGFGWTGSGYDRVWQKNDMPPNLGVLSFMRTSQGVPLLAGVYRKKLGIWGWDGAAGRGAPTLLWSSEETSPLDLYAYGDSFYYLREDGILNEIRVTHQPPAAFFAQKDGQTPIRLSVPTRSLNGYVYLPVAGLLANRGWTQRPLGDGRTVEVSGPKDTVILLPGQPGFLKNGIPTPTVSSPQMIEGQIWLPLDLLPLVTDLNWRWDQESGALLITPPSTQVGEQ